MSTSSNWVKRFTSRLITAANSPRTGFTPPTTEEPPPKVTTAMRSREQYCRTSSTSASVPGAITASGAAITLSVRQSSRSG